MQLAHTLEARQQQAQRIDPRQILASEILAWTSTELEAAIEREVAENPALEVTDDEIFQESPFARSERQRERPLVSGEDSERPHEDSYRSLALSVVAGGSEDDPLDRVASSVSLQEYLYQQIGQVANGTRTDLLRYLIDLVDDRGYLVADVRDVAERFRVATTVVEEAISRLQTMEPIGIGARDLQECLVIQATYLEQTGEGNPLATRILTNFWQELAVHREDRIATRLRVPVTAVRQAITFLRKALTPYPASMLRTFVQSKNMDRGPAVRPDILFTRGEAGYVIELARDYEAALTVAPLWKKLAERDDRSQDESMRRYIRDHVDRAATFMNGISRRGQTLRRIAQALVEHQIGYLETGNRAFLRPLTRQMIAERLGLDESVISRAVADKWVQLPSGELLTLDSFFGNAHAIRDALVQLVASEDPGKPYSDDELVEMLAAQGHVLARRTVAKYRSLEKILPARLRKRDTQNVVPARKAA